MNTQQIFNIKDIPLLSRLRSAAYEDNPTIAEAALQIEQLTAEVERLRAQMTAMEEAVVNGAIALLHSFGVGGDEAELRVMGGNDNI